MLTLENRPKTFEFAEKTWITEENLANLLTYPVAAGRSGLYALQALSDDGEYLKWDFTILQPSGNTLVDAVGQTVSGGVLADLLKRRGSALTQTAGLLGFRFELVEVTENREKLLLVFRRTERSSLVWRSKE